MIRQIPRWLTLPLTLAAALVPLGCFAFQDALLMHIQRNQAKLHGYKGVLVEKGLVPDVELSSDIAVQRPDRLALHVRAPEAYRGISIVESDDSLTIYWPQVNYAIRTDHLPHLTADDQKQLVADTYWYGAAAYDGKIGGGERVAGHATTKVSYTAKKADNPERSSSYAVDDQFSIPLAGEMHFAGGSTYGFRFESIDFNPTLDDPAFALALPPSTIVTHWDLAGPNVPVDQAKARANFALAVPSAAPAGYALEKIVQVEGPVPAFAFVYHKGVHFLLLTEYRDLGVAAAEIGVPVAVGTHHGKLLPGPLVSSYGFHEGGVAYQVLANLPPEEVVSQAGRLVGGT